jgi:hypothetical protein
MKLDGAALHHDRVPPQESAGGHSTRDELFTETQGTSIGARLLLTFLILSGIGGALFMVSGAVAYFGSSARSTTVQGAAPGVSAAGTDGGPARPGPGDTVTTSQVELLVESVAAAPRVGGQFMSATAPEGSTYVVVRYTIKNISAKPLGMFDKPSVHLVDPAGVEYDEDLGGTAAYATSTDLDEKVLSDLNPGIRTRGAAVFNVATDRFKPETWSVVIKADQRVVYRLTSPRPPAAPPVLQPPAGPSPSPAAVAEPARVEAPPADEGTTSDEAAPSGEADHSGETKPSDAASGKPVDQP